DCDRPARPFDPAQLDAFIAGIEEIAAFRGMRLSVEEDFDAFARVSRTAPGRAPITPMFDPERSDLGGGKAFWIKGVDEAGDVVHLQAARVDDLDGMPLIDWLEGLWAFYADPAATAKAQEVCFCAAPMAMEITGRVAYHGEVWLRDGCNSFRGYGLGGVLPRMAIAVALKRWQPDYMYGIAWPRIVEKGMARFYGYRHFQPHGAMWNWQRQPQILHGDLIWLTRQDMIDMTHKKGRPPGQ
ncbi:MAG: hypothetical protein R3316_09790, partial [Rhodovibrionaceae bacterium]|nr:hypothetical protein [Rhodovibrionaceae bacterium]